MLKKTLLANPVKSLLSDGFEGLANKSLSERMVTYFWLLGPFVFLIERTPADVWIVIIDLAFLVKCAFARNWSWMKNYWVVSIFVFWFALFISSFNSPLPWIAFSESLIWIRFPLLVIASVFWLAKDSRISALMIISTGAGLACMFLISTAELWFSYENWKTVARFSWPYGDFVTGNYYAKTCLIITILAGTLISQREQHRSLIGILLAGLIVSFSILAGERMNALVVVSSLGLTILWLNYKRPGYIVVALSCLIIFVCVIIQTSDYLFVKFTKSFIEGVTKLTESGYIQIWQTSFEIFKSVPITGIGTATSRFLCDGFQFDVNIIHRCSNHPHQFYLQVLAETGIVGMIAFLIMVGSIIKRTWESGHYSNSPLKKCCFIIPLAFFFPIQSNADLFGQWMNSHMWFGISLAMALALSKNQTKQI